MLMQTFSSFLVKSVRGSAKSKVRRFGHWNHIELYRFLYVNIENMPIFSDSLQNDNTFIR